MLLHANCVEVEGIGILLLGPSGAGKSDLTLRLIDDGARLVSDDYVNLRARDGALIATAPPEIAGLMEIRGLGILRIDHLGETRIGLAMDLAAWDPEDRIPEPRHREFAGLAIPIHGLDPFMASAPARVRMAAGMVSGRVERLP